MKLFLLNKWKVVLGGTCLIFIICLLGLAGYINKIYHSPINTTNENGSTIILVPRGSTFDKVTASIREIGLIPYPRLYRYLAKQMKAHSRIQSGEFEIRHSWNTNQLLRFLISGKSILHRITIPEGLNFLEIATRLNIANLGNKEILLSLKNDPYLLKKTGVPEAKSLEGFYFQKLIFFLEQKQKNKFFLV